MHRSLSAASHRGRLMRRVRGTPPRRRCNRPIASSWPCCIRNRPVALESATSSRVGQHSSRMSAPPRTRMPPSMTDIIGVTIPSSGRGVSSTLTSTSPAVHINERTNIRGAAAPNSWGCRWGRPPVHRAASAFPVAMVNLVSSTKSCHGLCARVDLHEHPDGLDRRSIRPRRRC